MINIPLVDIKGKIKENSSLSDEEINNKIKEKLDQLSGLISEEGAAHIIANELRIKLFEPGEQLQVKNILAGMRNVEVVGKITTKYELREFSTEKRSGKIASFIIADETGFIRVVLWNDQTDKFDEMKEGDTIKIKGAYARDNNGRKELHLSSGSEIEINPSGVKVADIKDTVTRKQLKDLAGGDENVEVVATIVQVFDPHFYEVCPDCGKRIRAVEEAYSCPEHGTVKPDYSYVLNLFLDDGTDNIRAVLWKNQTERLLEKTTEEMKQYKEKLELFEPLKTELLGTIVKIVGRTNKNEAFDRLELVANLIYKDVNPDEEIKRLKEEVKKAVGTAEEKVETESKEEPEKKEEISDVEKAVLEDEEVVSIDDLEDVKET